MEDKIGKNKKITAIILAILFFASCAGNVIVYLEISNTKNDWISVEKKYKEKEKENNELETTYKEIKEDNEDLENINSTIEETKKEYFEYVKQLENEITEGKSDQKIAYLTFDDGPYYNTYKVLDILDQYDVKATFFTTSINGEYCYDNKKENCYLLYKEYFNRGHTIANHTYTHGIRKGLYSSVDSFMEAVKKQEEHIERETGYITNIVRFPGGVATAGKLKQSIIEELRKNNYGWIDWTAQDGDGGNLASKEQAWHIFTASINSDIEVILLHDYNNITISILPDIIEYLQKDGYTLLPLFYESKMVNK